MKILTLIGHIFKTVQRLLFQFLFFVLRTIISLLGLFVLLFSIGMLVFPDIFRPSYLWNLIFPSQGDDEGNRNPARNTIQIIEDKRRILMTQLNKPQFPPEIQIIVNRNRLVEDSFNMIMPWIGKSRLHHSRIEVKFLGEEGIDAGGLTREWLLQLSKLMADPAFGLFRVSDVDNSTLIMSTLPGVTKSVLPNFISRVFSPHQMRLQYFQFFGLVIGKAIYENLLMDCHFSSAFYKQLLGIQCDFSDLEAEDPVYFKNLLGMMDYSVDEAKLDLTFSVLEDENTKTPQVVDLKPNGRNIVVTDSNKFEYITLMTEYKLMERVKMQMEAFKKGLYEIIPLVNLQIFNENELELLICGLPDIDLKDWKSNSEYVDSASLPTYVPPPYGVDKGRSLSTLIAWFWKAVESFNREQRASLLQFVTGTTKVPLGGFANLRSSSQIKKFNIIVERCLNDRHLPNSRTCFNQLILPSYNSYDTLRQKLLIAITESSTGFGTM